jgi:hypothetical protein
MINHFKEIVTEQIIDIFNSGLYDNCTGLWITAIGGEAEQEWLAKAVSGYSKVKLRVLNTGDEKDTLKNMLDSIEPGDYVMYIHTKGVTHCKEPYNLWRRLIGHKVVNEWKNCLRHLKEYGCVGPLYRENTYLGYYPHFSGNFWWATYEYIQTLNNTLLEPDYKHGRMGAEFWIGTGDSSKIKCCYGFNGIEPFKSYFNVGDYVKE